MLEYMDHLTLRSDGRELRRRGNAQFPCSVYGVTLSNYVGHHVPWHWHDEIELKLMLEGTAVASCGEERFLLHTGERFVSRLVSTAPATLASDSGNRWAARPRNFAPRTVPLCNQSFFLPNSSVRPTAMRKPPKHFFNSPTSTAVAAQAARAAQASPAPMAGRRAGFSM